MTEENRRQVHPLVGLDYTLRLVGHFGVMLILFSAFTGQREPTALWLAAAAQGVVWPHLAYLGARSAAAVLPPYRPNTPFRTSTSRSSRPHISSQSRSTSLSASR